MCGITGFVGAGERETLLKMTRALLHRGPDNQNIFWQKGVGLGHTRLAILDLRPEGNQPMFSPDRKSALIFNGEIYNFQELRVELASSGTAFRTATDTEVIIALYERFGEKCFERLRGMFAIALYDFEKERLFLARDPAGKKPLYWRQAGDALLFASELKALFEHPRCTRELNLVALNEYLLYEFVPTPKTIFKDTWKLEPGHFLVFEKGRVRKEKFFRPSFAEAFLSFDEALQELDRRLAESVRLRLVADVPLGVFLSGGLDSSTIAAYAVGQSRTKVKTFSIAFDEASFDESAYAAEVARFLGTEHYAARFQSREMLELLPDIFSTLDEPLADASMLPTALLSRFTKKTVTVALSGDGGDELFAGYPTFQAGRLARGYQNFPQALRRKVIEPLVHRLPVSDKNFSLEFELKKFIDGFAESAPDRRHMRWLGSFGAEERRKLFTPAVGRAISTADEFEAVERYRMEALNASVGNRLLYLYERLYMMDGVLVKVDRASMRYALEVRSPFLDSEIIRLAHSLPYDFKLRGFTGKFILKKLMMARLPRHIVFRKKKGFGVPLSSWLKNELRPLVEATLSAEAIKKNGLFNYRYVRQLMDEHFTRRKNNRKKLWTLIVFMRWYEKFAR